MCNMIVESIERKALYSIGLVISNNDTQEAIISCTAHNDYEDKATTAFSGSLITTLSGQKFINRYCGRGMVNESIYQCGDMSIRLFHIFQGYGEDNGEDYAKFKFQVATTSDINRDTMGIVLDIDIKKYANREKDIEISTEWNGCLPKDKNTYSVTASTEPYKTTLSNKENSVRWIRLIEEEITFEDDTVVIIPAFYASEGDLSLFDPEEGNTEFEYYTADSKGEIISTINKAIFNGDGSSTVEDMMEDEDEE